LAATVTGFALGTTGPVTGASVVLAVVVVVLVSEPEFEPSPAPAPAGTGVVPVPDVGCETGVAGGAVGAMLSPDDVSSLVAVEESSDPAWPLPSAAVVPPCALGEEELSSRDAPVMESSSATPEFTPSSVCVELVEGEVRVVEEGETGTPPCAVRSSDWEGESFVRRTWTAV
jgi:hypothetical protein